MQAQAPFISFEGIEGVGKTTLIRSLSEWLTQCGHNCMVTREPGGTGIAELIRKVLLDKGEEPVYPETEALLLYAGRVQHIQYKIKPALEQGTWVLSDRFFDATFAYQGGGRKLSQETIMQLHQWAIANFAPDITFLLDAPVSLSRERVASRDHLDRIELERDSFFERVRAIYLERAKNAPERFCIVDASWKPAQVLEFCQNKIKERFY